MQGLVCCDLLLQKHERGHARVAARHQRLVADRSPAVRVLHLATRLEGNHDARHTTLQAPDALPQRAHDVNPDAYEARADESRPVNVAHNGGAHGRLVGVCDDAAQNDLKDDGGLVSTTGRRGRG